jgi:hypothetical protein
MGSLRRTGMAAGFDSAADKAIRDAILQWQYEPMLRDDHAVPVCMVVVFEMKSNRR